MSAKTTGPSGDLSDVFAAEAPRCGFGGLFDESLLARRFDRLFTHHRARLEASIAGTDRAREAVKPLGVALTFAASGYPVNDGYPPRGPGRKRDLGQELVGSQHGGHRGKEEVPGSDRALASGTPHGEPGAERHHHRRQLGGGIGVRENAAERAARGSGGGRRKAWPGQSTGSAHGSAASARARAGGPELRSGTRRRDPDSWWPAWPTRLMSITWPGRARRKSSMGTRLWPPARVRASSPWRARRPSASATVRGS